jgi:hypothetical protein
MVGGYQGIQRIEDKILTWKQIEKYFRKDYLSRK